MFGSLRIESSAHPSVVARPEYVDALALALADVRHIPQVSRSGPLGKKKKKKKKKKVKKVKKACVLRKRAPYLTVCRPCFRGSRARVREEWGGTNGRGTATRRARGVNGALAKLRFIRLALQLPQPTPSQSIQRTTPGLIYSSFRCFVLCVHLFIFYVLFRCYCLCTKQLALLASPIHRIRGIGDANKVGCHVHKPYQRNEK